MLKHLEISQVNSCLNKAQDDEPVFVLRANDELAPTMVRSWAKCYQEQKAKNGQLTNSQIAKIEEAFALAQQMEDWKASQPN